MAQIKAQEPGYDLDAETPTTRERKLAYLAQLEKNKEIKPQRYDVTSTNAKALRVIHDCNGRAVAIPPAGTKQGVLLHPGIAEYLGKTGLTLTLTAVR
jgi:hypothetical protein